MLKLDWGDAQIWMKTAEALYLRSVGNPQKPLPRAGYPHTNKLNVATVCAGYAFELIFKVLARAGGKQPKPVHEPSAAYEHLTKEDKGTVARIILKHGWNDSGEFLTYLDENLCDRDRKYWGRSPKGGKVQGTFHSGGRKDMDALKRLHEELSDFAMKRIEENPEVHEDWPGTNQRI